MIQVDHNERLIRFGIGEAEHSATLYVGNVRIDIYSSCGREQLKTLVEMLHIC